MATAATGTTFRTSARCVYTHMQPTQVAHHEQQIENSPRLLPSPKSTQPSLPRRHGRQWHGRALLAGYLTIVESFAAQTSVRVFTIHVEVRYPCRKNNLGFGGAINGCSATAAKPTKTSSPGVGSVVAAIADLQGLPPSRLWLASRQWTWSLQIFADDTPKVCTSVFTRLLYDKQCLQKPFDYRTRDCRRNIPFSKFLVPELSTWKYVCFLRTHDWPWQVFKRAARVGTCGEHERSLPRPLELVTSKMCRLRSISLLRSRVPNLKSDFVDLEHSCDDFIC